MFDFDKLPPRSVSGRAKKYLAMAAALAVLAVMLVSIFGGGEEQRKAPAPNVLVATAETRDVPVLVQSVGKVIANATVQIRTRVEGAILETGFTEGQFVKKGDLLFRIDPAPYAAALRAAEADLQRDEARLVNAQLALKRSNELVKNGGVSAAARDTAQAEAKAAAAAAASSKAALDQAQLNLSYTEIRSPIDGKTGAYLVDAGNIVRPSSSTSTESALVTITQIQPVKISFTLPQQYLPQLQKRMNEKGLAVSLTPTSGERPVVAPVEFISNQVSDTAGTVELRGTYANNELQLVPGQFMSVAAHIDLLKQTTVIPRKAVNIGPEHRYAFVVGADDKAELRPVKVLYEDDAIAAIGDGVKPGERVVIDGQMDVKPGEAVNIVSGEQGS